MYYPIGAGPLYRVGSAISGNIWPAPVQGHGAFYVPRGGNRYSGPHQLTLYCAEDPLVAIVEAAYYQALSWHNEIASYRMKAVNYPLRSEHLFWAFQIAPLPNVIDLENPLATNHFAYSPHVLLNPSRSYSATQAIADDVRTYNPPPGAGQPTPEGMKVPLVRTPYVTGFQPHHLALFVMNMPGLLPFDQRSQLVAKMRIEFEFFTHSPVNPVGYQDPRINWAEPKVRVSAIPGEPSLSPIPAFPGRPNSRNYRLNIWHKIGIDF